VRAVYPQSCSIADVGTGCGAIAVALAVNLPHVTVYAIDMSGNALAMARRNCRRHGVGNRINLLQGDMLDALPESVHLIVANLPYVKDSDMSDVSREVAGFEPYLALSGGVDGLDMISRVLEQAHGNLRGGGAVLLEIAHDQGQPVCETAEKHFPGADIGITKDYSSLDRVVSIRTTDTGQGLTVEHD